MPTISLVYLTLWSESIAKQNW